MERSRSLRWFKVNYQGAAPCGRDVKRLFLSLLKEELSLPDERQVPWWPELVKCIFQPSVLVSVAFNTFIWCFPFWLLPSASPLPAVHSAFPGSMQHCIHLGCGGLMQGACGEALSPSAWSPQADVAPALQVHMSCSCCQKLNTPIPCGLYPPVCVQTSVLFCQPWILQLPGSKQY